MTFASSLKVFGLIAAMVAAACGGGDDQNNAAQSGARCKQAVQRNRTSVQVCCNEGETIVEASMCTYGGFIASCTRPNDNCIQRTNDGEYAVNCWSESCKDCPSAPSYDVLVSWCGNN